MKHCCLLPAGRLTNKTLTRLNRRRGERGNVFFGKTEGRRTAGATSERALAKTLSPQLELEAGAIAVDVVHNIWARVCCL